MDRKSLIVSILIVSILIIIALAAGLWLYWQSFPKQSLDREKVIQDPQDQSMESAAAAKECDGIPPPSLTEGPYHKKGSPQRTDLRQSTSVGTKLTVTGYVFDTNCQSVPNARLDFWQADGNGNYDNVGFRLRGHQFTDAAGKYTLETVIPGQYPGRTPHIHVKVQANENSQVLTSQLFLPDESSNATDSIFNEALIMKVQDTQVGKSATFNFVISK